MSQSGFPHHDDGRAGYVEEFGEVGLRVSVTVPPIFELLSAGRLCFDGRVVDRGVSAVGEDGVEESRVRVLVYGGFLSVDCGGEWFVCHGVFSSFRLLS